MQQGGLQFYWIVGTERRGPVSLVELVRQGVQPTSLVWHPALKDWTRAIEVPELRDLFLQSAAEPATGPYAPPGDATSEGSVKPHSKLGITSLVLGLLIGLGEFALVVVAGIMETTAPNGIDEDSGLAMALGLLMLAGVLGALIGAVLGVIGLVDRERSRLFPLLGVGANGLVLLALIALVVIGLALG